MQMNISQEFRQFEEGWKEKKEYWRSVIEDIILPEEIQGKIPYYESKLDAAYTEAIWEHQKFSNKLKEVDSIISEVKKLNKKGSNKEERDRNAIKAVKEYSKVDLLEYSRLLEQRVNFYEKYVLAAIKTKSDRLTATIGALKVDVQLTPH